MIKHSLSFMQSEDIGCVKKVALQDPFTLIQGYGQV